MAWRTARRIAARAVQCTRPCMIACTARAAREKHRRYSEEVWPLAYTSYGRLGGEGIRFLELLCAEAREASGSYETQRGLVASWRRDLERALLHAIADSALQSLGAKGLCLWEVDATTRLGPAAASCLDLAPDVLQTVELKRQAAITCRSRKQITGFAGAVSASHRIVQPDAVEKMDALAHRGPTTSL